MKRKRISRMLAVLLAFTMVFTMMPAMVWADGETTETCEVKVNFDISSLGTDEALKDLEFQKIPSATVSVEKGTTLGVALKQAVDKSNGELNITGIDNGYITAVNQVVGNSDDDNSAFVSMMESFGVDTIPSEFQYAGWMYSGEGLTGYGIQRDVINQDTTVNFRYTLYYGKANASEWKNFDWDFVDAYNALDAKIFDAQTIVDGGFDGFNDAQKQTLEQKIVEANVVKKAIYDAASGIWACYIADKKTGLWGPSSPTASLQNACSELNDAINKTPTPTGITCTAIRNDTEELSLSSKATVYVDDVIKLLPSVLPEGANQQVIYDVILGGDAISITEDGVITCNGVSSLVMIQVKSAKIQTILQTVKFNIAEIPTYSAKFSGADGVSLVADSITVKQGQQEYTGTASDGSVSFAKLKAGEYDYVVTTDTHQESGKLIITDSNVDITISGKNPQIHSDSVLEGIASSFKNKSDDWSIMEMSAYSKYKPNTAHKTTADAKQKYINQVVTSLDGNGMGDTAIDKAIIALTALGGDATKIYRVNDNNPINAVEKLNAINKSTSAWSAPYTLAAYNQKDYKSDDYENTLITALLESQGEDGSWDEWGTIDTTANAIAGLSFYKGREDVAAAIEKGINYLGSQQKLSGAFDGGYGENSNSTAMVIVGLTAAGVNPDTDYRFVKNGKSALDGLLSFALDDNSGFGYMDNSTVDSLGTEQSFRALIAASVMLSTGKAYNIYDFSANEVAPVRATGIGTPSKPEDSQGDNIEVKFTIKADNGYWINNATVTVPGTGATVYHAFIKACESAGITYDGAEKGYVRSMSKNGRTLGEFDGGPNSGWMYKVNDELPKVGLTSCSIKDGDNIVWFYTEDWTKVPGAMDGVPSTPDVSTSGSSGSATTTTPTQVAVKGDTATATVKDENAKEIIKQAEVNKSKEIVIDVKKEDVKEAEKVKVDISVTTAKDVLDKTEADLTVNTPAGSVTLTQDALKEAVAEAKGKTITVEVSLVSKPTEIQQNAAGTNGHIIAVTIKSDDKAITTFGGKTLTIKSEIPAKLNGKTVIAIHIADDGKIEKMTGKLVTENGKDFYEFETPHLSTFALADADEVKIDEPEQDKPSQDEADKAAEQKAKIKKVKTTVTLSTKGIKKGIKVTVKVPESKKADKTGIIIYRSTSKNAKPYAVYKKVSTKGSTYIIRNTKNVKGKNLTKGKTYYYKARAYKVINGKTYYGPMSAIKSIKAK